MARRAPSGGSPRARSCATTDDVPHTGPRERAAGGRSWPTCPPEAAETLELIDAGGPFPEDEDGGTFGNREDLLPDQQMGYYARVHRRDAGPSDRGARRIVAGDERGALLDRGPLRIVREDRE